jgi:hypothetical protein
MSEVASCPGMTSVSLMERPEQSGCSLTRIEKLIQQWAFTSMTLRPMGSVGERLWT